MPTAMPISATSADAAPPGRYHVAHYGKSRNFALYEGKNLLAVTLYKKGAETLQHRPLALSCNPTVHRRFGVLLRPIAHRAIARPRLLRPVADA